MAAATLPACFEFDVPGEVGETMTCPVGESCVSTEGLGFQGAIPHDLLLSHLTSPRMHPTAVGGTQRISFGTTLDDVAVTADPPSILAISTQDEGGFVVRGVSAGSATVSVRDSSGRLYDRIALQAVEVESIALRPTSADGLTLLSPGLDWSFFPGAGEVTVVVALESAGGERLIDETAAPVAADTVEVLSHESAIVTVPSEGDVLSVPITLGSGEVREASAPLVSAIDRWTRASDGETLVRAPTVEVGGAMGLCFIGMSGGRAVYGVPIEAEPDELLAIEGDPTRGISSCVTVRGQAAGIATLTVRGGGAELQQTVFVE